MHFLHIAFLIQFSFAEGISQMAGNNGLIPIKQGNHLRLA
jgi:hypothetical protein